MYEKEWEMLSRDKTSLHIHIRPIEHMRERKRERSVNGGEKSEPCTGCTKQICAVAFSLFVCLFVYEICYSHFHWTVQMVFILDCTIQIDALRIWTLVSQQNWVKAETWKHMDVLVYGVQCTCMCTKAISCVHKNLYYESSACMLSLSLSLPPAQTFNFLL